MIVSFAQNDRVVHKKRSCLLKMELYKDQPELIEYDGRLVGGGEEGVE